MSRLILALPLALLAVSFAMAPYVSGVGALNPPPPPLTTTPYLLYRHENVSFFYTSADLLHPEVFGKPGQYIESVVFDVSPRGEEGARPPEGLTWFVRIWNAIKGEQADSAADLRIAEEFREWFGKEPRLDRGGVDRFALPETSTYRRASGLRQLVGLGIRLPPDGTPGLSGTEQLFPQALARAFRDLRGSGLSSVGVPRMGVRATLGADGSRGSSWQMIMRDVDTQARAAGLRTVLFGGWGVEPRARESTDAAFRTAWEGRRSQLAGESHDAAHERLRLGALIAFGALLRWHRRWRPLRWIRVLALGLVAGTLALGIAEGARSLAAATDASATLVFALESIVALAVGLVIERVVTFDPKKILQEDAGGKPA